MVRSWPRAAGVHGGRWLACAVFLCLWWVLPAAGGEQAPAVEEAVRGTARQQTVEALAETEARPLRAKRAVEPRAEEKPSVKAPHQVAWHVLLLVLGLAALLWGGLFLAKKYLPGGRALFQSPAMEVLGRTHIDPRRYVALVRVGKRVLVVGVGPDEMRPLADLHDEGEVLHLLEESRTEKKVATSLFQRLFEKQIVKTEEATQATRLERSSRDLQDSIETIRARVRNLRQSE